MDEVVDFEVYLNVNREGFKKSSFDGLLMFDGNEFEGFIGENFIFGELTDRGLKMYTLFKSYKPVRYETTLDNSKNYEGTVEHHIDWDVKNDFSCGLVRILFTRFRQYNSKETEELKKQIESLKSGMNRDNQRFYETVKASGLPEKQQPKTKEKILVSA